MAPPAGLFADLRGRPASRIADVAPFFPPFDAQSIIPMPDTQPMLNGNSDTHHDTEHIRASSKKATLSGYAVVQEFFGSFEEESSDDDSDSESEDSEVMAKLSTLNTLVADALIDNEMASAMQRGANHGDSAGNSEPLQHVLQLTYYSSERSIQGTNSQQGDSSNKTSDIQYSSSRVKPTKSKRSSRKRRRRSSYARRYSYQSGTSLPFEEIRTVFGPGSHLKLKSHHAALNRVVETIFGFDSVSMDIKKKTFSEDSRLPRKTTLGRLGGSLRHNLKTMRRCVSVYVHSKGFTLFFMCLTLSVIFGPDLFLMLGNRELEPPFLTFFTIVLGLFVVEFCLLACGAENYLLSIGAALDLIAAYSLLKDTWIFHYSSVEGSIVLQQSRVTRLTRVARMARIPRLVPRIMDLFRRHRKTYLAKRFLMRRLRRAFLYLDIDQDGLISSFDVRCLYITILQSCGPMLQHASSVLLKNDANILSGIDKNGHVLDESENHITFQDFAHILFASMLGHDVLRYHLKELQSSNGVWALTSSISDNMALKVCVGLLALIVMLKLVEHATTIDDVSPEQGLLHLYSQLLHAKKSGMDVSSYVCQWIAWYQDDLKVLFLYMDGVTWVDYGSAACPSSFFGEPFNRIDQIMELASLRSSDVCQACLPPFEDRSCPKDRNNAVALIDERDRTFYDGCFSLLATVSVMVMLGILIIAFSHEINAFTHNTLNPTRALVDDMMAISSLELVHVDAEMPANMAKEYNETPVEELRKLQTSFKAMRSAIRSWSSYVPPSVVERLLNAGVEATIGVSTILATILFIDVDGFEDACDGMEPQEVNQFLATVFEKFAVVIHQNRGTLLEFIGDEVLAVYNTPNAVRTHVFAAVNSALQIHRQIATLPKLTTKDGRIIQVRCRCGVHTAHILAGNIGSRRRMKYGLLGDGVNLTARLKNLNSKYNTQTIASQQVYDDPQCARKVAFRVLDRVAVKGKTEPTTVYEAMEFQRGYDNSQKITDAVRKHGEAAEKYYQQNFAEARSLFCEVANILEPLKTRCRLSASELDQPSRQMKKKCTMYIKSPPGSDWDGVEHLKAKTFAITDEHDDDEDLFDNIVPNETKLKLDAPVRIASISMKPVSSAEGKRRDRSDAVDTHSAMNISPNNAALCDALVSTAFISLEPLHNSHAVAEGRHHDSLEIVDSYPAMEMSANSTALCSCSPPRCALREDSRCQQMCEQS